LKSFNKAVTMGLGEGIPAVIGFVYFTLNVLAIIYVGFHFYGKSAYAALCNYFVQRRVILLSLTVYYLDTATDIVVLLTWLSLMQDEESGAEDYESIDMKAFFWPLVAFIVLYQMLLMFSNCDSHHKLDVLLSPLQLYPFRALWVSLRDSNIEGHTFRAQKQQETKKQNEVYGNFEAEADAGQTEDAHNIQITEISDKESTMADDAKESTPPAEETPEIPQKQDTLSTPATPDTAALEDKRSSVLVSQPALGELHEHNPTKQQRFMLILQCVVETIPGMLLQLVFWIRSANDPVLSDNRETWLIPFSIVVSVITITDRFVRYIDDLYVVDHYKEKLCGVYLLRVSYRTCSLLANFVVLSMIWCIVGGMWIAIWAALSFIVWLVAASKVEGEVATAVNLGNAFRNVFALPVYYPMGWHIYKFVENVIGMILVLMFLWWPQFLEEVEGVVSADTRRGLNEQVRVQFLFAIGWAATLFAFALYQILDHLKNPVAILRVGSAGTIASMWSRGADHER